MAVYLGDLHAFDLGTGAWADLSAAASVTPPSPRAFHGFASAGGKLYVHGGEFCDPDCGEAEGSSGLQRMRQRFSPPYACRSCRPSRPLPYSCGFKRGLRVAKVAEPCGSPLGRQEVWAAGGLQK